MKIFISHAFADEKLAFVLKDILTERGITVYLAQEKPEFGKQLPDKILKSISDSDYVIVLITTKAKESASVQNEIGYALGKHIKIIIMSEEKEYVNPIIGNPEQEIFTQENFAEHCKRVRMFLLEEPTPIVVKVTENKKTLRLVKGDITKSNVDVIVNAANSQLKHHGGLAKHIVENGGYIIQKESNQIGFVPVGQAVITGSGRLSCKAVIHAIGPRWGEGNEENKLKNAVKNSLELASKKNFQSISMPAISAGIYRFPKDKCAKIIVSESVMFFHENPKSSIDTIEFCIYEDETLFHFKKQFESL
jgi:O-acetyl-ADP-ribose deacetylase (regulator of RNase III)